MREYNHFFFTRLFYVGPEVSTRNRGDIFVPAKISSIHPKTWHHDLGYPMAREKEKVAWGSSARPSGSWIPWAESHLKMTNMCGCSGLNWVCNYRVLEVFEVLVWWFFPFPPIPPGPIPREGTKCTFIDNAKNDNTHTHIKYNSSRRMYYLNQQEQ